MPFVPGDVDLQRVAPPIIGKAWRANPPRPLPIMGHGGGAAPAPVPIEWTLGPDEPAKDDVAEKLGAAAKAVAKLRRARAKRKEKVGSAPRKDWEASSSSESTDSGTDGGSGGGGGGGGGDGPGPGPAPIAPVAPVPPAPPGPGIGHGLDWQEFTVAGVARFIRNPYNGSIGCHCLQHGKDCRVNRVATKLPVGYFVSWSDDAVNHAERDSHFQARLDTAPGGVVSYINRCAARERVRHNPLYTILFEWELPEDQPEPR